MRYTYFKDMIKTADGMGANERAVRDQAAKDSGYTSGELLYTLLGAAGGGGLGYWLGGLGNKNKTNRKRRLIAALIGGGAGALGTNIALDAIGTGEGDDRRTLRQEIRGGTADPDKLREAIELDDKLLTSSERARKWAESGKRGLKYGGPFGAFLGMIGKGIDFSGRRVAKTKIINDVAKNHGGAKAVGQLASDVDSNLATNLPKLGLRENNARRLAGEQIISSGKAPGTYVGRWARLIPSKRMAGSIGLDMGGNAITGAAVTTLADRAARDVAHPLWDKFKEEVLGKK